MFSHELVFFIQLNAEVCVRFSGVLVKKNKSEDTDLLVHRISSASSYRTLILFYEELLA